MGKYQYMNLEQKLAKIRKKMPVLLKKYHNIEADYDFATLDDIYESLTPALNKYGVNFDIVKETPTQYGEDGNPVYLTLDKDDYWRYEADLEICWTNIDNPKEITRAVTHIVGTHEIPDKAHGTALTYGLKYYFRNRFCMRQLGSVQEDPDGMEYSTEEDAGVEKKSDFQDRKDKDRKSVTPEMEKTGRKNTEYTAESGKHKISGNACPKPDGIPSSEGTEKPLATEQNISDERAVKETEKSDDRKKAETRGFETVKTSVQNQNPEHGERRKEMGNVTNRQSETAEQKEEAGDGFHAADTEEVPFEDGSFLDTLEQELEDELDGGGSSLEAARNYVCNFGLYQGKTLGEMMDSGVKGVESVKWMATRYKGPDKQMTEAAKLLIENMMAEQRAA